METSVSDINSGYLYIAVGNSFVHEAARSATSLRNCRPDAHITLLSDKVVEHSSFDRVIALESGSTSSRDADQQSKEEWKDSIFYKIKGLQQSPYKKTFFVDTDTYFCDDCSELFDLLEHYDLLLSLAPADYSRVRLPDPQLEGYLPYNTGVMVFRKSDELLVTFGNWLDIYRAKKQVYPHDQTALMEALLESKLKIYSLHSAYNFRLPYFNAVPAIKVKLLHGRHWDIASIAELVNERIEHRAWHPKGKMYYASRSNGFGQFLWKVLPSGLAKGLSRLKRRLSNL